jgi:hypothetical protein
VSEAAACLIDRCRIDCRVANVDKFDLSVGSDHERGPVAHAIRPQNSICFGDFAIFEIAQQREVQLELSGELFLRWGVVGTDAKNKGTIGLEFRNTSLVCREFLRSAAGERGREKCQNDHVFAFVVGQRNFSAGRRRKREVGCDISHLQRLRISGLLRNGKPGNTDRGKRGACGKPHG